MKSHIAKKLSVGQKILHIRTSTIYSVVLVGKLKIEGTWKDSITYSPDCKSRYLQDIYTRHCEDFKGFELYHD